MAYFHPNYAFNPKYKWLCWCTPNVKHFAIINFWCNLHIQVLIWVKLNCFKVLPAKWWIFVLYCCCYSQVVIHSNALQTSISKVQFKSRIHFRYNVIVRTICTRAVRYCGCIQLCRLLQTIPILFFNFSIYTKS